MRLRTWSALAQPAARSSTVAVAILVRAVMAEMDYDVTGSSRAGTLLFYHHYEFTSVHWVLIMITTAIMTITIPVI